MKRRVFLSGVWLLACACADVGQARVELPLYLAGSDLSEPIVFADDLSVRVERAELAFGPLYLCAGATAGELCDAARLEWLGSAVVDLRAELPVRAGELEGVTGQVRSYMYDLGISSQLTRREPYVLDAAEALDGASLQLALTLAIDGRELPLTAAIPVQQTDDTELGVPVIRKSAASRFAHEVRAQEPGLLLRFDAGSWLRSLDARALRAAADCEDCAAGARLEPESDGFRALRNAVVAGARPSFEWGFVP